MALSELSASASESFSQPSTYRSLDSVRRLDVRPELTSQVFSSDIGSSSGDQCTAWYRLLEIIAAHNIPIIKDSELQVRESPGNGTIKTGTFGSVAAVPWIPTKTGVSEVVAIKRFNFPKVQNFAPSELRPRHADMMRNVMFEIDVMGRCDHENIVKLRGILFEETAEGLVCPALAMEVADTLHPDLETWFQQNNTTMDWTVFVDIATGTAEGLDTLHALGVIHADLKPTNILMFKHGGSWQPKLSDFGLSGITVSSDAPRGGTRRWNAPECLPSATPNLEIYSTQPCRDIYSFGLLLVYMLRNGRELFESYDGDVDKVKLDEKDIAASFAWSQIPEGACKTKAVENITSSTLRRNPRDRAPRAGVVARLLDESSSHSYSTEAPESHPAFVPFGNISVSREHRRTELPGFMTFTELHALMESNGEFPAPLRKALVEQFRDLVADQTMQFPDIPLGLRFFARSAMSEEEIGSLHALRPGIEKFYSNTNNDFIQVLAQETMKGSIFLEPACMISVASDMHGALSTSRRRHTTCSALIPAFEISEVHRAAYRGDYHALSRHISQERGLAMESNNAICWTPLHSAILARDTRAATLLLEAGVDVNAPLGPASPLRFHPLFLACFLDDEDMVRLLLSRKKIDIWAREDGWWSCTVAHFTADCCKGDTILRLLLAHEPLLAKSRDVRRRTPLHRAAGMTNLASVKLLLKYGVNVNATDVSLITPLHKAYAGGNGAQGYQQLISGRVPDLDASLRDLQTRLEPVVGALSQSLGLSLGPQRPEQTEITALSSEDGRRVVNCLLNSGADPEAEMAGSHYTPECYAYRPSDLVWSRFLSHSTLPEFEPQAACVKATARYRFFTGQVSDIPSLHIRAFRGSFSLWGWLPEVLPCPKGLLLTCRGARMPTDTEAVPIADYDVKLEVWMYPPNEAKTKTRLLWSRRVKMNTMFSKPDRAYNTMLGVFRIPHKCKLLINMRSDAPPNTVLGHFVFSGFKLDANTSMKPEHAEIASDVEVGKLETDIYLPHPKTINGLLTCEPNFGSKDVYWRPYIKPPLLGNPLIGGISQLVRGYLSGRSEATVRRGD